MKEIKTKTIKENTDAVYFFGLIGSAVYFVGNASGFVNILIALLKSIVWPAFLVYELFKYLGA